MLRRVQLYTLTTAFRLPQRRTTTGNGSRLPSKHFTSGSTSDTTTNNNNNNNNSPPGDSSAHHGSRDCSDVTPDQSGQAGKRRARKAAVISAGGRVARPFPGHGETVESSGPQTRRAGPVAGKFSSLSATNSPASLNSTSAITSSSRKQTTSTSLTDVTAAKTETGRVSPELARRKATTSSRLAVSRATASRPPKIARPASDGGGAVTGCGSYRGTLGSKLPSMVSGSVGAINGDVMKSAMTSSFHCTDEKQQQQQQQRQSSNYDRRPGASTSSGRLTELRAQFGVELDTQRAVASDLPSPSIPRSSSASHQTTHDAGDLPLGHEDRDSFLGDCQPLSEDHGEYPDWQKNCESPVDGGDCHGNMSDLQSDAQYSKNNKNHNKTTVLDGQGHHHNAVGDHHRQQHLPDGHEMHNMLTKDQEISQTGPRELENNYESFMDERRIEDSHTAIEDLQHQQSRLDAGRDPTTIQIGQGSPGRQLFQLSSNNNHELVVSEDCGMPEAAAVYWGVDRTTSCDGDVMSRDASCSDDVMPASPVVMTTDAETGGTCPTTVPVDDDFDDVGYSQLPPPMSSCFPSTSLLNARSSADVTSASCHVITQPADAGTPPQPAAAARPTTLNCAALNVKPRGATARHAARKLHRADLGIDVGIGIGYGGGSISDSEVTSLATTQQTSITRNRLYHHHHHHHQLQQQGQTEGKTNAQRIVRLRDVCAGPPRRIMQAICESPEIMSSNSTDVR